MSVPVFWGLVSISIVDVCVQLAVTATIEDDLAKFIAEFRRCRIDLCSVGRVSDERREKERVLSECEGRSVVAKSFYASMGIALEHEEGTVEGRACCGAGGEKIVGLPLGRGVVRLDIDRESRIDLSILLAGR